MAETKKKDGRGRAGAANIANAHKKSPCVGDNGVSVEAGDNSKYARFLGEVSSWPPIDKTNVDSLEERFNMYIQFCINNDMKIGNQACYFALGINKDDVYDWTHGRKGTPRHSDFIKKVREFCAAYREFLMQDGKVNPVTGIFWQKNYDGLKDQQDLVLTPNQRLSDMDTASIAEKYKELPDDLD